MTYKNAAIVIVAFQLCSLEAGFAQNCSNEVTHFAAENLQANATPDSTATTPKLSAAPIVACGLLGMVAGAGVGGLFDRPHKMPEGEPANLSNGIVVGWAVGAVVGSYLGYRLAKMDVKRQKIVE